MHTAAIVGRSQEHGTEYDGGIFGRIAWRSVVGSCIGRVRRARVTAGIATRIATRMLLWTLSHARLS